MKKAHFIIVIVTIVVLASITPIVTLLVAEFAEMETFQIVGGIAVIATGLICAAGTGVLAYWAWRNPKEAAETLDSLKWQE